MIMTFVSDLYPGPAAVKIGPGLLTGHTAGCVNKDEVELYVCMGKCPDNLKRVAVPGGVELIKMEYKSDKEDGEEGKLGHEKRYYM